MSRMEITVSLKDTKSFAKMLKALQLIANLDQGRSAVKISVDAINIARRAIKGVNDEIV